MFKRYSNSENLLQRSLRTIPLGSQTFSKSYKHYPYGSAPFFIERASGSKAWDVDGNEYIDFASSLCSIILGYNNQYVMDAVKKQLDLGTIFSLPHPIEVEVAEKIVELVPCADKVRFGKNGSDVTSAAIRLARSYTKKDHVAVCGYHGWQDWYIGITSRNFGVPKSTQKLTHPFSYNRIETLYKLQYVYS